MTSKTATDQVLRQYTYQYDGLNRLKKGIYSEPGASVPQNGFFNETLAYDLNGNITSLQRNGKSSSGTAQLIDNLTYNYTGNKLNTVTDTSGNYSGYPDTSGNTISYDDNGNMKDHVDKGVLQIDYNFLNLPDYLKFDQLYLTRGVWQNVNVNYTYSADGTKLRKIYKYSENSAFKQKTTEYLDGFQYEVISTNTDPLLKFVPTAEGYYNFENNKYIYSYTDHLGNVRLSYSKNLSGSAEALEENNYYAFGLKHEGYNALSGNPAYSYGYNGKELQKETGWGDYGARMYMADIGRWGVIDPLAEQMRRHSPYNYAFNNPVNFVDPDGRAPYNPRSFYGEHSAFNGDFDRNTTLLYGNGSFGSTNYAAFSFADGDQGGGGGTQGNGPKPGTWQSVKNFFKSLFGGGKKSSGRLEVGPAERIADYDADGVRLFGLITGANYNPMEEYRANRDNPFYNEGESSLDRSFRLMNSSHIEIMQDFGGGGYNMFGGYGRIGNVAGAVEEVSIISKISAEAEANGILSTQRGINPAKVAEYFEQMSNGTYKPTGGAGYIYEGKYILTDGNHRMNAAIKYGIESGNFKYIEEIINKGNFIRRNPLIDNYKVYKLPVK